MTTSADLPPYDPQRLLSAKDPPGERQVGDQSVAHHLEQTRGAPRIGHDAVQDLGKTHLGALPGHAHIA